MNMTEYEMAKDLQDLYDRAQKIKSLETQVAGILETVPVFSEELFFGSEELHQAATYETKLTSAELRLTDSQTDLKKKEHMFLSKLPKTILSAMREDGKFIHAMWIAQGQSPTKFGPHAAYFDEEKLVVEPFTNFHAFKEGFEHRRSKKQ